MKIFHKIALGACLLVLLPYIYLSFFAEPCCDDYAYASAAKALKIGLWAVQLHHYNGWTGRYVASFLLSYNPLTWSWLEGYKLVSLMTFLLFWFSCLGLFWAAFKNKWSQKEILCAGTAFLAVYVVNMPSVTEAFYWLSGYATYTFSIIYLNFSLMALIALFRSQSWKQQLILFSVLVPLSVLIIGSNETTLLFWMMIQSLIVLYSWWSKRPQKLWVSILWFLSIPFCLLSVLAPGNSVRQEYFENRGRIFESVFNSLIGSLVHFIQFLSLPLIFGLLLFTIYFIKNSEKFPSWFFEKKWILLTRWSLLGVLVAGLLPGQWAMGGPPPTRTDNVTYYLWLYIFVAMFIQVVVVSKEKYIVYFQNKKWLQPKILMILFVASLALWKNNFRMWPSLTKVHDYKQFYEDRYQVLKSSVGQDVVLKKYNNPPSTIHFGDITEDPAHWTNAALKAYFNLNSVKIDKTEK